MRYIGNKTRLLEFILGAIQQLGIRPGSAHDAFSGTAAVGRALKEQGWRVASSDVMTYAHVLARAYVVAQRRPSLAELFASDAELRRALPAGRRSLGDVADWLARALPPERGFVSDHFSPRGRRMYFTRENAGRIDAVRRRLHEWHDTGALPNDAYHLLLAALIEGADRVANTAGVYAAYIKSWQSNALRPLRLEPVSPMRGPRGSTAHRADAATVARELGAIDLIYIDPPYNTRQYAGYYHVPEIIARGWFDAVPQLRGKTGLLGDPTLRSAWSSPRHVRAALRELLAATRARHALVSYNSEGLIPPDELHSLLAAAAVDGQVRPFSKSYKRYRADSDHAKRRYRAGELRELLYYVKLR